MDQRSLLEVLILNVNVNVDVKVISPHVRGVFYVRLARKLEEQNHQQAGCLHSCSLYLSLGHILAVLLKTQPPEEKRRTKEQENTEKERETDRERDRGRKRSVDGCRVTMVMMGRLLERLEEEVMIQKYKEKGVRSSEEMDGKKEVSG